MLVYAVLLSTWRSSTKVDCFDNLEEIFESYTDALMYVNKKVFEIYNQLEHKEYACIEEMNVDDRGREIHRIALDLGERKYFYTLTIIVRVIKDSHIVRLPHGL